MSLRTDKQTGQQTHAYAFALVICRALYFDSPKFIVSRLKLRSQCDTEINFISIVHV